MKTTTTRSIRFFAIDGTTRIIRCDAGITVDAEPSLNIPAMFSIKIPGLPFIATVEAEALEMTR